MFDKCKRIFKSKDSTGSGPVRWPQLTPVRVPRVLLLPHCKISMVLTFMDSRTNGKSYMLAGTGWDTTRVRP